MPIDSIAKLRYSPEKEAAYRQWITARKLYKEESSYFQRLRRQLPKAETDCSYEQLVSLAVLKQRYSRVCKDYWNAQCRWNAINSPLNDVSFQNPTAEIQKTIQMLQDALMQMAAPTAEAIDRSIQVERYGTIESNPQLALIAAVARERMGAKTSDTIKESSPAERNPLADTDEIEAFDTPSEEFVPPTSCETEDFVFVPPSDTPEDILKEFGEADAHSAADHSEP